MDPITLSKYAAHRGRQVSATVTDSDLQRVQSGIAIADASCTPTTVTLELMTLEGTTTGAKTTVNVPGNGQMSAFMNQIPGLTWSSSFQGVLRISAQSVRIYHHDRFPWT